MLKRNNAVPGNCFVLIIFLQLLIAPFSIKAQHTNDTAKIMQLAALDKKENINCFTKEANVVFPEMLCGAEEQTLGYIEKFSSNRREYLIRTYNKGKKYFPKVVKILKKHNIPAEFRVLLALESAFNGNAVSNAGAVGYWQIMDEVAQEYGLKYVPYESAAEKKKKEKNVAHKKEKKKIEKDERKDFYAATRTAARYLKDRSRNLNNNYLMVVASYNCGVGNVWSAMKKTGLSKPDFWDIKKYLPSETRSYVMNFIALNVIFNNYEKFVKNKLVFKPLVIKIKEVEKNLDEAAEPTSLNY